MWPTAGKSWSTSPSLSCHLFLFRNVICRCHIIPSMLFLTGNSKHLCEVCEFCVTVICLSWFQSMIFPSTDCFPDEKQNFQRNESQIHFAKDVIISSSASKWFFFFKAAVLCVIMSHHASHEQWGVDWYLLRWELTLWLVSHSRSWVLLS